MTPERLEQARQIARRAASLPAEQRGAYLDRACGSDAELRAAAEALLAEATAPADELGRPHSPPKPDDQATTAAVQPSLADPSAPHIPGYRLVRRLSHGGQGIVFEAVQLSTRQKVAIKVLHSQAWTSHSARRRFEREIELIAQLRHPDIIRIFHSGTAPDGRLYYVMEYVRGEPLHQFVRSRELPLEETLRLFARVCEAVQHAHQRGVIHRDLKPANILVDTSGNPKVLDFGLAKTLAGSGPSLISLTHELLGTMPYMSPEQARGSPDELDTRSDVYALGVILYELLTGGYPYPVRGQTLDVLRHILESPPVPPSRAWKPQSGVRTRSRRRGRRSGCPIDDEVETIVLRALAKERDRRYPSAGDLARDLRHYLSGEPIEAKRDSGWYLLRKSLARHRFASVTAALLLVVLIQTAAISMLVAQRRAHQLDQLRQAIELYNAAIAFEDRGETAEAIRRYRQAIALAPEFFGAWFNLGNALRDSGQTEQAAEAYRQASRLDPANIQPLANWALMLLDADRPEQALTVLQQLAGTNSENPEWLFVLGEAAFRVGNFAQARRAYEQILVHDPSNSAAMNNLALALMLDPDADERNPQRAFALADRARSIDPADGDIVSTWSLASLLACKPEEALTAARRALELKGPNAFDLLIAAECLEQQGETATALEMRQKAEAALPGCTAIERQEVAYLKRVLGEYHK